MYYVETIFDLQESRWAADIFVPVPVPGPSSASDVSSAVTSHLRHEISAARAREIHVRLACQCPCRGNRREAKGLA